MKVISKIEHRKIAITVGRSGDWGFDDDDADHVISVLSEAVQRAKDTGLDNIRILFFSEGPSVIGDRMETDEELSVRLDTEIRRIQYAIYTEKNPFKTARDDKRLARLEEYLSVYIAQRSDISEEDGSAKDDSALPVEE